MGGGYTGSLTGPAWLFYDGHAGYDYEQYSGFAFGMGLDRITMVRHKIDSISHLYESDLRFLGQF